MGQDEREDPAVLEGLRDARTLVRELRVRLNHKAGGVSR